MENIRRARVGEVCLVGTASAYVADSKGSPVLRESLIVMDMASRFILATAAHQSIKDRHTAKVLSETFSCDVPDYIASVGTSLLKTRRVKEVLVQHEIKEVPTTGMRERSPIERFFSTFDYLNKSHNQPKSGLWCAEMFDEKIKYLIEHHNNMPFMLPDSGNLSPYDRWNKHTNIKACIVDARGQIQYNGKRYAHDALRDLIGAHSVQFAVTNNGDLRVFHKGKYVCDAFGVCRADYPIGVELHKIRLSCRKTWGVPNKINYALSKKEERYFEGIKAKLNAPHPELETDSSLTDWPTHYVVASASISHHNGKLYVHPKLDDFNGEMVKATLKEGDDSAFVIIETLDGKAICHAETQDNYLMMLSEKNEYSNYKVATPSDDPFEDHIAPECNVVNRDLVGAGRGKKEEKLARLRNHLKQISLASLTDTDFTDQVNKVSMDMLDALNKPLTSKLIHRVLVSYFENLYEDLAEGVSVPLLGVGVFNYDAESTILRLDLSPQLRELMGKDKAVSLKDSSH